MSASATRRLNQLDDAKKISNSHMITNRVRGSRCKENGLDSSTSRPDGRQALGKRAGATVRRCGASAELLALAPTGHGPCHARGNGFDLHAAVVVPPQDRARLERLCRYALRPPVATDRLHLTADGQVMLDLRHRWADGTTHLLFEPVELRERLAALTPRPRINLLLYYGVLGARSAWRSRLREDTPMLCAPDAEAPARPVTIGSPRTNWLWAELMQRSFGFDVLACPRCGGRFRLVALIEHAGAVRRILRHLGLPAEVPPPRPARAPPRRPQAAIGEGDLDAP